VKAKKWLGVVAGLALPAAGVGMAEGLPAAAGPGADVVVCQNLPRSRASSALNDAINSYGKGDFEAAADSLKLAQAGANDLTPVQQEDLKRFLQLNEGALKRRADAADQVRQAAKAEQDGHDATAADLAQKALANQYVAPADKQRAQAVVGRLRNAGAAPGSSVVTKGKLLQARKLLSEGNLDAAEQLAQEADHAGVTAGPGEDSPKMILAEIAHTRQDPALLLTLARAALARGDYERAEELAKASKKAEPVYAVHLWGDSPNKVLDEVQAARASGTRAAKEKDSAHHDAIRQVGDGTDHKKEMTASQKPDHPTAPAMPNRPLPSDPKGLLKVAHEAYEAGQYDDAIALAQKAKVAPGAKDAWGLFDFDTPDKLINEVNKARNKRNQEESVKLLTEGRKLLDQAEHDEVHRGELLDAAQKAALRADSLRNGTYSVWELGDRPTKLLADVDEARKKGRVKSVPPVPPLGGSVASNDGAGRWPVGQPDDAQMQQARRMMSDARAAARAGNAQGASKLIDAVERMNLPADKLGSDSPAAVRRELALVAPGGPAPADGRTAKQLVAEARQLQARGQLLEARARLLEAQKLPPTPGADEDRPEKALLELSGAARRQMDFLESEGDKLVKRAADPHDYVEARDKLAQAQALARGFQLDTDLLDKKLAWVQLRAGPAPSTGGTAVAQANANDNVQRVNATDGGPQGDGERLLSQARMEIRAGNSGAARRLVEQVYAGTYGLKPEAEKLLHSIDVEEYAQKQKECQRTFDAANAAFRRGDYQFAGRLLHTFDAKMLDPERQEQMKQMMLCPEMQPGGLTPTVAKADVPPGAAANDGGAPRAHASDADPSRQADYLKQIQDLREIKFQKMRYQELDAEKQARKLADAGDTEHALEVLEDYLRHLPDSGLDPDKMGLLRRPAESKLQQYRTLDSQKKLKDAQTIRTQQQKDAHNAKEQAEVDKQKRLKELMDKYNTLFRQAKYSEAEMYALQAHDLDPDNTLTAAAVEIAKRQAAVVRYRGIKQQSEDAFLEYADQAHEMGPVMSPDEPYHIDKKAWNSRVATRKPVNLSGISTRKTEAERKIESQLYHNINMNFNNLPLGKILDDLATTEGINIVPDENALGEQGITLEQPLSIKLDNISLKSGLKLLLDKAKLTYVIEDDVLKVTTKEHARGKMKLVPYQVTDLVIPLGDSGPGMQMDPSRIQAQATQQQPPAGGASPVLGPLSMVNGTQTGSAGGSPFASAGTGGSWDVKKTASATKEDQLITLIQNTVAPKSWAQMGGQGTIDYFPLTMTLVINQTPDVQEQIADLLAALRRLQDAEVAVELRLISIAEGFFERIGVDFNINIVNDKGTQKFQPEITSGNFKPAGFINDFTPQRFLSGLTPAGTFTSDLGIPIKNSSFGMAIPPFGGFPNAPGANGGIELGLAFLSDIQVFMFMEAAQGDQRTNVMQAPKLTLFNGQRSTLTVTDQQFFVTSASVVVVNGQPVFIPNNQVFAVGVTINITAVISADRRFVRLAFDGVNGGITLTNLSSAVVPLFPIVQLVPTVLDGNIQSSPVAFTQFFQQPVFNTVSVVTTVAVPDGGTVLMGGLKRLSEGRNEFGPPVLSKIPYLDRLFRNVGYGREVQNLMLMVTPRVIINEEEELRQTGVERPQAGLPQ
jgi:type II secretory pathway component GspD/PulD (secretin)